MQNIKEYTVYSSEINSYGVLKKPLCKFYSLESATNYINEAAAYKIDNEGYTKEEKNTPNQITLVKMGIKFVYEIESLDMNIDSLREALKGVGNETATI